jgi:hypothetical protein
MTAHDGVIISMKYSTPRNMVHTYILQEDKNHHSTVSVKEQTSLQNMKNSVKYTY